VASQPSTYPGGTDQEVLLAALGAVIFTLWTPPVVPVTADQPSGTRTTDARLGLVSLAPVSLVGPAPKAATLNDLRFDHHAAGCSAEATIDIRTRHFNRIAGGWSRQAEGEGVVGCVVHPGLELSAGVFQH
jgi:hypothetical protein